MVVLHLEPRELGALRLQVRVHDKRLVASFQAQSPEVETLLRIHLPSLHESLSQHGFEVQSIAITRAAEGFSAHMGTGTGAFAHQHSAFQAFAAEQHTAHAGETQSEVDLHKPPRWPSERRPRLLDVVI
jgi:flagellar hook-length control protein FliK